ncbi:MAG: VOC family protein [Flavisolibacter sp.]
MIRFKKLHHIALICSDYSRSKEFYTKIMGLKIIREVFRKERNSYKLDLSLNGHYVLELFSFPKSPGRLSGPEACGLRHLAFEVDDVQNAIQSLKEQGVEAEGVRIDEYTGKRFSFFVDPDGLPIELYEC